MLWVRSETQKVTNCLRDKSKETEGRLVVIKGWALENGEKLLNSKKFYFGMMAMCGMR